MSTQDLSLDDLKIVDRIQKLLDLASKNPSPHEAASALAKAQALMEQYNLSSDTVSAHNTQATTGRREQAAVEGGTFSFQRELWRAVCELNFCVYWSQEYLTEGNPNYPLSRVKRRRHAVVGRVVNVRTSIAMATYLQSAIERALDANLTDQDKHSNWAWSFRKGVAAELVLKIRERRDEREEEERKEIKKRMKEAAAAGEAHASTSRTLTISDVAKSEHDANMDHINGEGWSAARAADRAKQAAMRVRMQNAYTAWAKENPRAAMRDFEFTDEDGRTYYYGGRARYSGNTRRTSSENIDYGAFQSGRKAGEGIGLDPQAEASKPRGRIAGPKAIHL